MKYKVALVILIAVVTLTLTGLAYMDFAAGRTMTTAAGASNTGENEVSSETPAASPTPSPKPTPVPATPSPSPTPAIRQLRLVAVGDIMLGRNVGKRLEAKPNKYLYAFKDVASYLKKGDITFANLESPLTFNTHGLSKAHKIVLKASPNAKTALVDGGFDIVSLANNHMMDYYDTGLFDTMKALKEAGIAFSGGGRNLDEARKPSILEKNGLKIAFLSYTDMAEGVYVGDPSIRYAAGKNSSGVAPRRLEMIREDIRKIRKDVDLIAISLHWGVEETFTVTPAMVEFAHQLLDEGADMILGHHPHQFQGMELYKGKPVFYSMGNFIFDQNDPENRESFILDMTFTEKKLTALAAIPIRILEKDHVKVQTGKDAASMLAREASLCRKLGTGCKITADHLVFDIQ